MTIDENICPFHIDIAQADLNDLARRLDATRWDVDVEQDPGWAAGMPLGYTRELVDYWRHSYDWRAQEARTNAHPPVRQHDLRS